MTRDATATSIAPVSSLTYLPRQRVLMAHLRSKDLHRGWLGPVTLRGDACSIALECEGVGETGGEPAVRLRVTPGQEQAVEAIVAAFDRRPSSIILEQTST